jgi:hypothetical protein
MEIITAWRHISPQVSVKCFMKCCIANAVDGTDDDMLCNGSEEDGYVRSEYEEDKHTNSKKETMTLIGKGRQNLTCFVYCVYKIHSKIFFFLSYF